MGDVEAWGGVEKVSGSPLRHECKHHETGSDSGVVVEVVCILIQLIKVDSGARANGVGETKKECTAERNNQRRPNEMAPWALNHGSDEGGGDEKGRRKGGEERARHVWRPWRQGCRRC